MNKEEVQLIAKDFIGIPYKDHGRDKDGLDCFGLAIKFFGLFGYELKDYAYEKNWYEKGYNFFIENYWRYAEEVREPEPGDVILFRNSPEIVNHLAIFMGDGRFLHTTVKTGVVISKLSQQPFCRRIEGYYRLKK